MNETSKIHDCPNCTGNSFRKTTKEDIIDYNMDVICEQCGMAYRLVLKYPARVVNDVVLDLLCSKPLYYIEERYNTDADIALSFLTEPAYYNLHMYRFIANIYEVDIREITSLLPVTQSEYDEIVEKDRVYWGALAE